eukprot:gnl/MRDRNA2_/MRDRNA2_47706_c0_seq1.p1 gnl/MRDRNA2_/MRDRNA2_47706_c0~~gnl/MRDRNA2_/MRDRNA2_47706_c0_seq1.p1  ORF type:complete len:154 (+),score=30.36 gnl/MRDRNA2_/MRDRNA2_47706_c0_seq1:232-693(+)
MIWHGVSDGSELNLVIVPLPQGSFKLEGAPAAKNTSACITADFGEDGSIDLSVQESEIFAGNEGSPRRVTWKALYHGMVSMIGDHDFKLTFSECQREGCFNGEKPVEFQGEWCDDNKGIRLNVYLAAGGCNFRTPGLKWVTLQEVEPELQTAK